MRISFRVGSMVTPARVAVHDRGGMLTRQPAPARGVASHARVRSGERGARTMAPPRAFGAGGFALSPAGHGGGAISAPGGGRRSPRLFRRARQRRITIT